jgi:2-amino-4-hydroxy-6-hydroxymethyldihydropteridine diphosphokinase
VADPASVRAVIALGSNTGDRLAHLQRAAQEVERRGLLRDIRCSSVYDTPPEKPTDGGAFANAVMSGDTALSAHALLQAMLEVEAVLGRARTSGVHGGPRSIDLDLVLFGDQVLSEPGLHVPHPRFAERAFVLVPLHEIEPARIDPRNGRSVHSLLAALAPVSLPRLGSLRK